MTEQTPQPPVDPRQLAYAASSSAWREDNNLPGRMAGKPKEGDR